MAVNRTAWFGVVRKQAFAATESFQDVTISDTRVGAVQNQVVFRLTYTVQRP